MGNRGTDGKLRKSQINAVSKYVREHYDRISLNAPQGCKDRYKAVASEMGYDSLNQFIIDAIEEKIERG